MKAGKSVCLVDGCNNFTVAKGLCAKHYARFRRHGEVRQTRAKDWGAREKHPLYKQWCNIMRHHKFRMDPRWKDFWVFAKEVGEKPKEKSWFKPVDKNAPIGPNNFYWQKINTSEDTKAKRARLSEYQKTYRVLNMERCRNRSLKKDYGITVNDWDTMYAEQNGVCKICGKPESKIDRRLGIVRRLSVDHCHETGRVRGLLCADCNTAIGNFKHNPEVLRAAAKYCEEN